MLVCYGCGWYIISHRLAGGKWISECLLLSLILKKKCVQVQSLSRRCYLCGYMWITTQCGQTGRYKSYFVPVSVVVMLTITCHLKSRLLPVRLSDRGLVNCRQTDSFRLKGNHNPGRAAAVQKFSLYRLVWACLFELRQRWAVKQGATRVCVCL